MPKSFTDITSAVDFAFVFVLIISVVLLVFITLLMVSFVIKYNRKRHPVPSQVGSHTLLEIIWTVIPTLLALGMFYYGWLGYKLMRDVPPGAMEVTAIGRMWSWQFQYPNGKESTELYVPVGDPVKVTLRSIDVLHSFYLPAFRVKQDVVPGMDNFLWFQPKETGEYDIFCAEYCGQRHSYMLAKLVVVPDREFSEWIEKDVALIEEVPAEEMTEKELIARLRRIGERLTEVKGCNACHSKDGSALVGPTYKGLFGKTETVITDGEPREVTIDEAYIRRSILEPNADLVEGFQPVMPSQQGMVTDEEINALIEYIKTLR